MRIDPTKLPLGTKILIRDILPFDGYSNDGRGYFPGQQYIGKLATVVGNRRVYVKGAEHEYPCLIDIEGEILEDPDDNY